VSGYKRRFISAFILTSRWLQELVRLHGGTLSVTSTSASDASPQRPRGSTFTVSIPLGLSHLAPYLIDSKHAEATSRNSYGRAVVEEAARWRQEGSLSDGSAIDLLESEAEGSDGFPRALGLETWDLFFKKSDVILIGTGCFETRTKADPRMLLLQSMTMQICAK
jgi:hypothetical protein